MHGPEGLWTPEETQQVCCGPGMLQPILSSSSSQPNSERKRGATILGHPVPCSASLQLWESQAAPALCKVHRFAHHQGRHNLSWCHWLFVCHGTCKSGGFPFPGLTWQSLCLSHTSFLGSWDSPLHLLIRGVKRCMWGEETYKQKCCGRTVALKVIIKSLNTENIRRKGPELIIFKTHQFKL